MPFQESHCCRVGNPKDQAPFIGRHSDRTGERRYHTITGMALGAIGLTGSVLFANVSVAVSMVFFTIAVLGVYGAFGPFWSIPSSFLTATAAVGGTATINSIGNLGGVRRALRHGLYP